MERVGIVAVGHVGFSPLSPGISYKELTFEAATLAYQAAGLDPRTGVDSFVCASEDFLEGTAIFDCYVPDQIGGALRPVHTVAADGLVALATGVMLIRSGAARVVAVEAHAKASDIRSLADIIAFALDPIYERPLGLHPWFVAGLEMRRFLADSGATPEACAEVAATNRTRALDNPRAAYGRKLTPGEVASSPMVADPVRELDVAAPADGAVVAVLAAEEPARRLTARPVWVAGIGWATGSPSLSQRTWGGGGDHREAGCVRRAAERAYRQAGSSPADVDVAEIDDTFSYKQLQHARALDLPATTPINPSGGTLGRGNAFEANGLARVAEIVAQLRGEAGGCQVPGARVGLVQSWRGVPTDSGAAALLRVD
ncbi:MAG TPA: hypothetical protein VFW71_15975 [Actinomycetota bacterium]|nr:hypothetical protein [Actinomycetota bacterium]